LGISESPITTRSDPRGHHAFTRALLLAGLELPCDAGRLQSRSSIKRGERRGGIASGPEAGAGLFLVGGESAAGLPPALVDVCQAASTCVERAAAILCAFSTKCVLQLVRTRSVQDAASN